MSIKLKIMQKINFNFNSLGIYDVKNLQKMVTRLTDEDWARIKKRQNLYQAHQDTEYIPIIYNDNLDSLEPILTDWYKVFKTEILLLEKRMEVIFGKGFIVRMLLTKLKPNGDIPLHIDYKWKSLFLTKRIHLPIFTSDQTIFYCGNDIKSLKEGELWEINNTQKRHGVKNKSKFFRVHLILDYYSFSKEFAQNLKLNKIRIS